MSFDIARGLPNNKVDFNSHDQLALKSTFVHKYYIDKPIKIGTLLYSVFEKEMIIMPRTVKHLVSTFKPSKIVCLDRIYYLSGKYKEDLYYIIGILNSVLMTYWFEFNYMTTKIRGNYFDLNGDQIGSIPIKNVSDKYKSELSNIVKTIIEKKKDNAADTSEEEAMLNRIVFSIYGLSEEEVYINRKIMNLYGNYIENESSTSNLDE